MRLKPFYFDNHIQIFNKDCRDMSELADGSVQCVVTSPPYWGLRKYSGEQELIWGGDPNCDHEWQAGRSSLKKSNQGVGSDFIKITPKLDELNKQTDIDPGSGICLKCGASKSAFGLEKTPEMYIEHTIEILREIRRVLRKDGVVFWNIGDSYNTSPAGNKQPSGFQQKSQAGMSGALAQFSSGEWTGPKAKAGDGEFKKKGMSRVGIKGHPYLKPKDLCLIPFRVAIAAQQDNWWVRSVIIWSKPNPMPESVTDRPTESHEYILLLTKNARYYWDADAVREPALPDSYRTERPMTSGAMAQLDPLTRSQPQGRTCGVGEGGRNIRSVWEFPTQPYPEAHFAVFPEKLPEICIKAATPEVGCCSKCGTPWERVVEKTKAGIKAYPTNGGKQREVLDAKDSRNVFPYMRTGEKFKWEVNTLGWQQGCKCNADKVPSIVLDPFAGAGTTLWVAKKLNRRAVGYEISEEYCQLALERNRQQVFL